MDSGTAASSDMLSWSDLPSVCASDGSCITIILPAYHRGIRALPYSTNLKSAVRLAERLLVRNDMLEDREALLAPLRELAKGIERSGSGPARAILRSRQMFRQFYLPGPAPLGIFVGTYFHVLPLLGQLCFERQFYILGLSQEHLHLLHYSDGECKHVPLPDELPRDALADGEFTAPDHMLRDASPAGHSADMRSAIVFSTSTEREKAHERLHEFFRLIDRRLSKVLGQQRLLLSGVDYEIAIYRQEATYPFLMEGYLEGDLHDLPLKEIARRAEKAARTQARVRAERQLRVLEEMPRTERISFDIRRILKAAEEGRIAKLILAEQAERGETTQQLECDSAQALLNAVAVLSIRHGAEIFVLPASRVAHSSPVAAMFRY